MKQGVRAHSIPVGKPFVKSFKNTTWGVMMFILLVRRLECFSKRK